MGDLEMALLDGQIDRKHAEAVAGREVGTVGDADLGCGQVVALNGVEEVLGGR